MTNEPRKPDQFEDDADAIKGGGATTDRGDRDMGMPGPAPDAVEKQRREEEERQKKDRRESNDHDRG